MRIRWLRSIFFDKLDPVFVGRPDVIVCVGFKFIGRRLAIIQVKFTVDDFEGLWVYTGSLAGRR
jgi:hypothetical protein